MTIQDQPTDSRMQHPSRAREPFYPSDIRQLARAVEREQRKERWRRSRALRSTTIAQTVRAVERALGGHNVSRHRRGREWVFLVDDDQVAVLLHVPACSSFDELARPLRVEVLRPDVFDTEAFNLAWRKSRPRSCRQ